MKTVTLNNAVEMPILGFGVYQIPGEETRMSRFVLKFGGDPELAQAT